MPGDRFFDHPRATVTTSEGPVELPLLFRDFSSVLLFFRVPYARAESALVATPFTPVRFASERAVAVLAFLDYRDCSIGPYHECALMLAAMPRGSAAPLVPLLDMLRPAAHRGVGLFILDLPVTTPIARAAGCELWGLPKFVTPIDVDLAADAARCAVWPADRSAPIVAVEGRLGRGVALPPLDYVLYSERDHTILRTLLQVRGKVHTTLAGDLSVRARGDTRMARHVVELGLDGARASLAQACRGGQLVFHAGEPLLEARAA